MIGGRVKEAPGQKLDTKQEKVRVNKRHLEFFGFVFGENGMSADPKKCEVIKQAPPPTNVSELRSFLVMTNYVTIEIHRTLFHHYWTASCFTPKGSNMAVESGTKNYIWSVEISSKQWDSYDIFIPNRNSEIIVDASPYGLAGIMLQKWNLCARNWKKKKKKKKKQTLFPNGKRKLRVNTGIFTCSDTSLRWSVMQKH